MKKHVHSMPQLLGLGNPTHQRPGGAQVRDVYGQPRFVELRLSEGVARSDGPASCVRRLCRGVVVLPVVVFSCFCCHYLCVYCFFLFLLVVLFSCFAEALGTMSYHELQVATVSSFDFWMICRYDIEVA